MNGILFDKRPESDYKYQKRDEMFSTQICLIALTSNSTLVTSKIILRRFQKYQVEHPI